MSCNRQSSTGSHLLAQGLEIWDLELEQVGFGVMHLGGVMRICVVIVMVQGHVCAWRNRLLEEAVRGAPYCSLKLAASRRSPPSLCSSPSLIPLLLVQFYMSSASYASSTPHLTPPANRLGALRDLLRRQAILHNRPSTHQELCVLLDQLLAQHRSGNSTEGMSHKHVLVLHSSVLLR